MKAKITFEIDGITPEQLHEALCLAIHEGDTSALEELTDGVNDIQLNS